ncbi:hypothetical protein NE865_14531 [Phthorimaea operculella]|nr:hypothetical protein NE865_14531 [Phthorimaea operculella]
MKLPIIVVLCLIFTLRDASVNCGLVEKLFEKGHETIEKVKEDVNKIFHFDKKEKEINEPIALSTTPLPIENAKKTATDMKKNEGIEETTTATKSTTNSPTATAAVTTSSTTPASNSTDPQEGRDAFNGDVCAEGYKRTTDGRCKKVE